MYLAVQRACKSKTTLLVASLSKLIFIPAMIFSVFLPLQLGSTWFYIGSSNYATRICWDHTRVGRLGSHSSGSTDYQRDVSLFETSPVCNGSVAFSWGEHSFSFMGVPVVDHHIRRWSNSPLFSKGWRSPVSWTLWCSLSRIHEENSTMDRHTKITEAMTA